MIRGTTVLPGGVRTQSSRIEVKWENLTPHPRVMAETTPQHRRIKSLEASDGVMLIGYGDWDNNLGPVDVIGYNMSTLAPVTLLTNVPTEAFDLIRIINGRAFLPYTDPYLADNQGGYATNEYGSWEAVNVGPVGGMIHTFDVIKYKGLMMVCGSIPAEGTGAGVVYTEVSPGTRMFTKSLTGKYLNNFARFYKLVLVNGEVRVQNVDGGLETWRTTNGFNWTEMPNEPPYGPAQSWVVDEYNPNDLPPGYWDTAEVVKIRAKTEYDGWLWIGSDQGVVKRAKLPLGGSQTPFSANFTPTF